MPKTSSLLFLLCLPLLLLASACSNCDEAGQSKQFGPEDLPPELAKQAEEEARQELAGLDDDYDFMMSQLRGKGDNRAKRVSAISPERLKLFFPAILGWSLEELKTESTNLPFPVSQASGTYIGGSSRIFVKVTDSAYHPALTAPIAALLRGGAIDHGGPSGYERARSLAGQPAFERYDSALGVGEITLILDERFLLKLRGAGLSDPAPTIKVGKDIVKHYLQNRQSLHKLTPEKKIPSEKDTPTP